MVISYVIQFYLHSKAILIELSPSSVFNCFISISSFHNYFDTLNLVQYYPQFSIVNFDLSFSFHDLCYDSDRYHSSSTLVVLVEYLSSIVFSPQYLALERLLILLLYTQALTIGFSIMKVTNYFNFYFIQADLIITF